MNIGNVVLGRRKSPGGVRLVPRRPRLVRQASPDEDRRFSIKLEETFDVETVHNNDKCYFFVIKHDLNYFNVYFSSFTIRLAYPMPCKTLRLGEDGF